MVDIAAKVPERPKKECACPEVLEDLGSLRRYRWQALAIRRIRQVGEFLLRKAESLGCLAQQEYALAEKCEAAKNEHQGNCGEFFFGSGEQPKAKRKGTKAQIENPSPRVVFQITGEVF